MGVAVSRFRNIAYQKVAPNALAAQTQVAFQQALQFHQQGNLAQAQGLYEKILKAQPRHFDALHLSGVLAYQTKKPEKALELIGKAITISPGNATAYYNHALALRELKQLDNAVTSYNRAILLNPDFAEAYNNRGIALQELRKFDDAVASYNRAITLKPGYAEAYNNRGIALRELRLFDDAVASYDQAIALKPDYAEAYNNRGIALQELKKLDHALASYDRAITLKPDYADACYNRANALQELQRLDDAVTSYDRAIALMPCFSEAFYNRANALRKLRKLEDAAASYDKTVALKPDHAEACYNLGITLLELRQPNDAVVSYDRAIALRPDYAEAYWNKSLALLLNGDFKNGWELYEWRWSDKLPGLTKRNFPQPLWSGKESLTGKTILLHSEQGLGDTIQFCRYARSVAELCDRVILEVEPPLIGLLKELDGVADVIAKGSALPPFDYHCSLMSLPLAFQTSLDSVPCSEKYLRSNEKKLTYWAGRLGEKKKPRVGIVWSGSTKHQNDHNRSIPLADLIKKLPPHCQYVSLQKEMRDIDRSTLESNPAILHFGNELHDFTDTAALCELMDIIITVDTSVAHVAGAMGKTTWILLPFSPDWRWLLNRDDSPWYKSVKLYRQSKIGDWESVLARVGADLEKNIPRLPAKSIPNQKVTTTALTAQTQAML